MKARPMQLTTIALVTAGLLLVAPAAGASGPGGERASDQAAGSGQDGIVVRRDGSKADPFVANVSSAAAPSPSTGSGSGFDWGDAAIGAGIGALAAMALAGALIGMRRRRTGVTARPASAGSAR
jgi:hypothetical protein